MSAEAEKEWGGAWSSIKHSSADFHASNRELRWCLLPATAVALDTNVEKSGPEDGLRLKPRYLRPRPVV